MQRRTAGLCMAPSLLLGLLYPCRTPWRFAGGQLGGSTQGVDVMRKGSSAQGGLRAWACWRLAQVVVSEALRPFTLGLQFSYMKRGGAGAGEGVRTMNLTSWLSGIIVA